MLLSPCVADLGWLLWWVCGLCDFCSFVFCVVHAGMNDAAAFCGGCCLCWLCVRYLGRMVDALAC